jgi:PPP family 3-phenylpropionic acid transporter
VPRSLAWVGAGYLAYFGAVGVFQPYFPLHLTALGLSGAAIGSLFALWSAMRIVGPLGAAWLADVLHDRCVVLKIFALASAACVALLMVSRTLAVIAVTLAAASVFFNGMVPVYDTYALDRLGHRGHGYGRLRLWGSVGFIATSATVGALTTRYGVQIIVPAMFSLVLCTVFVVLRLPAIDARPPSPVSAAAFASALGARPVRVFLAVCFLHLAGFGGYYGFYTLYLGSFGYSPATIGFYWAGGVAAEIALFAFGTRLLTRFPLHVLLQVALGSSCLRWVLLAWLPGSHALMLAAQVLHLAGFGLFHSVTVLLGPRLLPAGAATRAQALVSSVGWGAGGIAGSLLAGVCWDHYGHRSVFGVGAVLAALAWALAATGLRRDSPGPGPSSAAAHEPVQTPRVTASLDDGTQRLLAV